jgi:Na+-driven multidrug efflux pump
VFLGFNTFFSGLFTAFSNGLISATLSFVRSLVILVLCLLILPKFFGGNGVWAAWPVAEVLSMIVCIVFILKYKDKYEYM